MKVTLLMLLSLCIFFLNITPSFAIEDPLTLPNNKFGIHILFPEELDKAASLINSNGGDWGYVTIPIQTGDRNLEKWQKFMDDTKKYHIIPIIRLATEGDYFNTVVWRKPTEADVLDFANFLNSLEWPVKNKYVVMFNEVNRGDEWQGSPNPKEYATLLNYAIDTFKSLDDNFFIISSGLDNASANIPQKSMNQYSFMIQMNEEVPGIFKKIDALGSHSYPNPGFSSSPWIVTDKSISSFKFEKELADELSGKNLPIFITETGWSNKNLSKNQIASYFIFAFESVWLDNVVAVTPFLLHAGVGPFSQFSLLNEDGNYNEVSLTLQRIPKIKGKPTINYNSNLTSNLLPSQNNIPVRTFSQKTQFEYPALEKTKTITTFFKWLLKLPN